VKTTLSAQGTIDIPKEIQEIDDLKSGEAFELHRVKAGEYLLKTMLPKTPNPPVIKRGIDGRLVFCGEGVITMEMVKEIESKGYWLTSSTLTSCSR
jgi:hypothetical protein